MKFIANILTDKPFKDNDLYNVVSDKNNLMDGIPTLVVGWEYTKKLYPEASILNWEVGNNVYWTYGNREKRNKYEENIVKFRQLALTKFIKSVKYKFYSLLTTTDEEKEYILNLIGKDSGSFIYMNYDMVYIFDAENNVVIGFSLRDIDYMGKERKGIFSKIYRNQNNNIIDIKDSLTWDTKNALRNCNYVIPYLYA